MISPGLVSTQLTASSWDVMSPALPTPPSVAVNFQSQMVTENVPLMSLCTRLPHVPLKTGRESSTRYISNR